MNTCNASARHCTICTTVVARAIKVVWQPRMSQMFGDGERVRLGRSERRPRRSLRVSWNRCVGTSARLLFGARRAERQPTAAALPIAIQMSKVSSCYPESNLDFALEPGNIETELNSRMVQ